MLRAGSACVWTGRQVLLWGGSTPRKDGCAISTTADGAAWTPTHRGEGSWTPMAAAPLEARSFAHFWWTGAGAVLVGGQDLWAACESRPAGRLDVGLFTPDDGAGSWRRLPDLPWPTGTTVAASTWARDRVLAWAPAVGAWSLGLADPSWSPLPAPPLEVPATATADVHSCWTGSRWLVLGRVWPDPRGTEPAVDVGLAYDPVREVWDVLDPGPLTATNAVAVWSGTRLFGFDPLEGLSSLDPGTGRWTATAAGPLDELGAYSSDGGPVLAWTGTDVLVWGGARRGRDTSMCIDGNGPDDPAFAYGRECNPAPGLLGAAYDAATDTWRPIPDGPWQRRAASASAWTGDSLFLAGGVDLEEQRTGRTPPFPDHPGDAAALFTPDRG